MDTVSASPLYKTSDSELAVVDDDKGTYATLDLSPSKTGTISFNVNCYGFAIDRVEVYHRDDYNWEGFPANSFLYPYNVFIDNLNCGSKTVADQADETTSYSEDPITHFVSVVTPTCSVTVRDRNNVMVQFPPDRVRFPYVVEVVVYRSLT